MSDSIKVSLSPDRLLIEPGEQTELIATIENAGDVVEVFSINIQGIDAEWYALSVSSVSLFPADKEQVRISITPPTTSTTKAGSYPLSVKVSSKRDPTVQTTAQISLDLGAVYSYEIDINPRELKGGKGNYSILLSNTGNAVNTYNLEASDPAKNCDYQIKSTTLVVEPGSTTEVPMTVKPKKKHFTGNSKTVDFTVKASPYGDNSNVKTTDGKLEYPPRVSKLVLIAVGAVTALMIIAIVVAVVLSGSQDNGEISPATNDAIVIELDNPANSVTNDEDLTYTGTTTAPNGGTIEKVEYSIDGETWHEASITQDEDTSERITFAFTLSPYGLEDRDYTIIVKATDDEDTTNDTTTTFTVDTIDPAVAVTAPNGGEFWSSGSITWTTTDENPDTVDLFYSTDDGADWKTIVKGISDTGTYSWIPESALEFTSVKVMVTARDRAGNAGSDESYAPFTLDTTDPTLTGLTLSPDQDYYSVGDTILISWTASDSNMGNSAITLEYWGSWHEVATGEANDGSYEWTIPTDLEGVKTKIRITAEDKAGNTTSLESNEFGVDSTNPQVEITSPTAGETLIGNNTYEITWIATDDNFSNTPITIHFNNGLPGGQWALLAGSEANDGSYLWEVPDEGTLPSGARIRITATDLAGYSAEADSNGFTIQPSNPLNITYPNGGETLFVGYTYNITWDSMLYVGTVDIDLLRDGSSETIVSGTEDDGSYEWIVSEDTSTQCRIRITSIEYPTATDTSDGNFTIAEPYITVVSPSAGDTWYLHESATIKWSSNIPSTDNVMIEVSVNGGELWQAITDSTPNNGTYMWEDVYPADTSSAVLIRVSWTYDDTVFGISNEFAIYYDGTPPTISSISIEGAKGNTTSDSTPTFLVTASDDESGINSVQVYVQEGKFSIWLDLEYNKETGKWYYTVPELSPLPDGTHTISFRAYDQAGNLSESIAYEFTIDSAPIIRI